MTATNVALRTPADEFTGPPKSHFTESEWYARDLEAIFRPRWLVVGHVDQLDALGDRGYITFSLGAEEAFIRRDEHGQVRAYHNFCRHRGARLCVGPSGAAQTRGIVCPYHQWTYSVTDGALINIREMHAEFDPAWYGLQPVHVAEWNGLIFLCFAERTPDPVDEYLHAADFGCYDLAAMKLVASKSHEIRANWKIVVENNLECYHCVVSHPELMEIFDWHMFAVDDFEAAIAPRSAGQEVGGYCVRAKFAAPACAAPSPKLSDVEDGDPLDVVGVWWEPGVLFIMSSDSGWLFVPKPLGPDRTELRQYWFVAKDAEEGRDYERASLMALSDTTMQQDRELCELVQLGMNDPTFTPGPLNRIHQAYQAGFYAWYAQQVQARFPDIVVQLTGGRSPADHTTQVAKRASLRMKLG